MSESVRLDELIQLTNRISAPELDLVILAEGNTSAKESEETFWVKASGKRMAGIGDDGFCQMLFDPVLEALNGAERDAVDLRSLLNFSRTDQTTSQLPSTEAFMHAFLLNLPEIQFAIHTHPSEILGLVCTGVSAEILCSKRLFPDEIVCCGPATCYVPYVAPGLLLARAIRSAVAQFLGRFGVLPKVLWLQNHGLITIGKTAIEAEAATLMTVKAARVWTNLLATGKEIRTLTEEEIGHIFTWPDEAYRQKQLGF